MFERLKNLIKSEKPASFQIGFDEIPSWLDNREITVTETLAKQTNTHMNNIQLSINNLKQTIQIFRAAQYNEEIHPKLKRIAKNTLPQFIKSMETALSKPLPKDIERFYSAAAEILKNCINSSKGQGKYLQTVFPDEMKSVKTGIDAIGHEINEMTGGLAQYRREISQISDAKKTFGALIDIKNDTLKAQEKLIRIEQRMRENRIKIDVIEKELQILEHDVAHHTLSEQRKTLQKLTEECEGTIRRYSVLSMTASHVLRKAENVAHKQHKNSEERTLKHAMDLLSDHDVPIVVDLEESLKLSLPLVLRMIERGEIILKNKEERTLFSGPNKIIDEITTLLTTHANQKTQCESIKQALCSHPVISRSENFSKEKNHLEALLLKEQQSQIELNEWCNELKQNIPSLKQKLEKTFGEISGNDVQIQYPDYFTPSQ